METTKNQESQPERESCVVDYASALRQYKRYGRGRSMKKFCEDEGYDYWKFCKLARAGKLEMETKSITESQPGFIEVNVDDSQSPAKVEESLLIREIRIRFSNGLVLNCRGGNVDSMIRAIRKIVI